MRAAASSAPSSAAGPLALADTKVAGNGAGAAAPEASSTATASDRSGDPSQEGTSGQPFAAALASAQADTDRKPSTPAASLRAPIDGAGDDLQTLQLSPVLRLDGRAQSGSAPGARSPKAAPEASSIIPTPAASAKGAAATQAALVAADLTTAPADASEAPPAALDGGAGADATREATGSKPRSGRHSQSALVSGDAALSTLAASLGAAAQLSSAAPASKTASSSQRSAANAPDATSPAATPSVASNAPHSGALAREATATSFAAISAQTADRAAAAGDDNGVSTDSSAAAPGADASAVGASTTTTLAPVMQNLSAVTNAPIASATASVGVAVAHPSWPNALAAQVQWMATRQLQSATLRLSPAHLGPLEVRIDVTSSQINVNFTAHHPDTREALAQAVPQLRQLFSAGGLNLGEATVRQEPRSGGQSLSQPAGAGSGSETVEPVANTAIQRLGLVDEYA